MTDEILEGHRTVQGDRQLHCRQRRAAPVEEVVRPADLVLWDAEYLRPGNRQPLLGRRARRVVALLSDVTAGELSGERCQRFPIDLAIGGQRQTFLPVEGPRDHVPGQRLTQPAAQDVDLEWPLAGVEGHQVLAAVGPLGDHHRTVADTGHPQQGVLDLADLDPEASDLDLGIPAAEEVQLALRPPAAVVAAPVEPVARAVRIGQIGRPGALGVVDVPAADADPGEDDHTGGTERYR